MKNKPLGLLFEWQKFVFVLFLLFLSFARHSARVVFLLRLLNIRNVCNPASGRTNLYAYNNCARDIHTHKKMSRVKFLQSPLKTKDFIFLLFFLFFFKKGGSNFLKTAYLFSIQPIKMLVTKTFRQNPNSKFRRKNKYKPRRF